MKIEGIELGRSYAINLGGDECEVVAKRVTCVHATAPNLGQKQEYEAWADHPDTPATVDVSYAEVTLYVEASRHRPMVGLEITMPVESFHMYVLSAEVGQ